MYMHKKNMLMKVGERQKRRKVAQLRKYASTALQCMESFGIRATSVDTVTEDGRELTLHLEPGVSHPPSSGATEATKQTLYLLDRFVVSDEFYHEIAQVCSMERVFTHNTSMCILCIWTCLTSTMLSSYGHI